MKQNSSLQNYIKNNLIFIFFPVDAGGHFLKQMLEIGQQPAVDQPNFIAKLRTRILDRQTNQIGVHPDPLAGMTNDFVNQVKGKYGKNDASLIFCEHYWTFTRHEQFIRSYQVNKFILITCHKSQELLDKRRKKHNSAPISLEENQLNRIFPKFIKNEFRNNKILEIEYNDLRNIDTFMNTLQKINKMFGVKIPIEPSREIVEMYLDKVA